MKNRRNIIESELPPQNHLDIWMKDGKFYRSTNKGWVLIEDQMEFTNSELMSKSTATSGTIGVNKETGEALIYNDVVKQWSPLGGGGGGMTEITYSELKDKRDTGKLIPGSLYRITDYNCTTTQENTQSAGHQFDIVLLALSENKLAEEGWAMEHPTDVYDVTFSDGVTKKCYLYFYQGSYSEMINMIDVNTMLGYTSEISSFTINEEQKTALFNDESSLLNDENLPYNYFQNSNLSAWKVWYSLDNDTDRFAWASDVEQLIDVDSKYSNGVALKRYSAFDGGQSYYPDYYYAWGCSDDEDDDDSTYFLYSKTESLKAGDKLYFPDNDEFKVTNIGSITGRGVIYRLIDEWNNDVAYDFKNIQFIRKLTNGVYDANGTNTWVYTFNAYDAQESAIKEASVLNGYTILEEFICEVRNNYICNVRDDYTPAFKLSNNCFLGIISEDEEVNVSFTGNKFVNACINNTISNVQSGCICNRLYNKTAIGNCSIWLNNKKVLTES